MSATTRWFSALLRLFPRPFREEYGADLLQALDDWNRDASRPSLLPDAVSGTAFLLRTALQERIRPTVYRRALPRPGGQHPLERLSRELRFTLRGLYKRPGFAAVALVTLALGVGANTAIFSVVHAVVLRPLPYPQPERLLSIQRLEEGEPRPSSMSQPDLRDIDRSATTLNAAAGYQSTSVTLTGAGEPEVVPAAAVDAGLLDLFATPPLHGRDLNEEDNVPGGERVAVVSFGFARARLELDRAVGATVELDGEAYRIVGVAPETFDFPRGTRVWIPLFNDVEGCGRGCHLLRGVARLAEGATIEAVRAELDVLAANLAEQYPDDNAGKTFVVEDLHSNLLGSTQQGLLLLLASVGLVLLIAAANLASLQLARNSSRLSEISTRAALGASRAQLCGLLLLETCVLALVGALLGVGLGTAVVRSIVALAPAGVPRLEETGLDLTVLSFGLAASLVSALIFSLPPSWQLARSAMNAPRKAGGSSSTRGRRLLLTGEVALSLLLLISAGLLLQTYRRVLEVDLGFEARGVASFFVSLPDSYDTPEKVVDFFDRAETELGALPGVTAVGGALGLPFSGSTIGTAFQFADGGELSEEQSARLRPVLPNHVQTLGMRLLSGRSFDRSDRRDGLPVALVNRTFARRFCDDCDPRGRQLQLGVDFGFEEVPRTIVGVVEDIKTETLTGETRPTIYVPQQQFASPWMSFALRSEGAPDWPATAAAMQRVEPLLALRNKETMTSALDRQRGPARFYFLLLSGFAVLAVVLALIGLYGVVSFTVARRRRELAIRMAVGARPLEVVGELVAKELRPVGAGLLLGLTAAALATRSMRSLLFGVDPLDARVYALGTLALLVVSLLALVLPALRARRISPAVALKAD